MEKSINLEGKITNSAAQNKQAKRLDSGLPLVRCMCDASSLDRFCADEIVMRDGQTSGCSGSESLLIVCDLTN